MNDSRQRDRQRRRSWQHTNERRIETGQTVVECRIRRQRDDNEPKKETNE